MSSLEAGKAIHDGIVRVYPDAQVVVRPLADGGEGTVEALTLGMKGKFEKVCVTGPSGEKVEAVYGILEVSDTIDKKTAIIEMSAAAGITLVADENRNPLKTTTYGVGEIIKDAIGKGCRHFIVGIGGSATNDGGIGMLQALGYGILNQEGNQVPFGAEGLHDIVQITEEHVIPELKECTFRVACDVTNAVLESGIKIVLEETKLEEYVKDADIVITGEGRLDGQTAMGKAPIGVADIAKKYGRKVIAFSGCVTEDAAVCNEYGIDAFFPILRSVGTLADAMNSQNARANMMETVEQVFRLIKCFLVN